MNPDARAAKLFDDTARARQKNLARKRNGFHNHFFYEFAGDQLRERLRFITKPFDDMTLICDADYPPLREEVTARGTAYRHILPGAIEDNMVASQLSAILLIGEVHAHNDPLAFLQKLRQWLKPDGLFLAVFPGGETMLNVRRILLETEISLTGGATPRVFPMIDRRDAGALLQRAGFALPVADADMLTLSYQNLADLHRDLKNAGETNIISARHRTIPSRMLFKEAEKALKEQFPDSEVKGRFIVPLELVYMIGWAPDASQQKPLPRGSGQVNLKDVLE